MKDQAKGFNMLKEGLYEQIINREIDEALRANQDINYTKEDIDTAESSKILSSYLASVLEKGLHNILDKGGDINSQITLVNKLINEIGIRAEENEFTKLLVDNSAQQLLSLFSTKNNISVVDEKIITQRPETSIATSSLFTGSVREPQLDSEIKKEIASSDSIDMIVSFIKWSGLRLIINELQDFTNRGGELRIITTSYMGATDIKAIEELRKLPNVTIKISYDTKRTRLHAKSYIFHRNTGFTTAYVGSSNMSNAALTSGLEWNVKLTNTDQSETIKKIKATFESYWNGSEFEVYSAEERERLVQALTSENYVDVSDNGIMLFDIRPYSFQQEILEALDAERNVRNHFKNLVIAATGTGKTVISAFDYKKFAKNQGNKPARLLFIAHREEILKQSLSTYRHILRDNNFGDMFVGQHRPKQIDHLFMSIQTFNSQNFTEKILSDFYDYIVIDEFHHAAAASYQKLLDHYTPRILLGLTATPERMDGKNILDYFDNRVAAEIRLPEAIDKKLLCPFQYFGVTDDIDLNEVAWARGGYDKAALSHIYTSNGNTSKNRAQYIAEAVTKYVTDLTKVKGLGFCVSKEHAKFMADCFNEVNIASMHLTSESSTKDRDSAKSRLVSGEIKFIFVVDLYNEGVDIPDVNTVLFLRPTESLTVFLQQLGRGLRLAEDKECLTVLDFIGQANIKYNFEDKFNALLTTYQNNIAKAIMEGFTSLPKGCYIQLEKRAKEHILNNIKKSFTTKQGLISRIKTFETDTQYELSLKNFLEYHHLDIRVIYAKGNFARLCVQAGVKSDFTEDLEKIISQSFTRFLSINSRRLIKFFLDILKNTKSKFTELENTMLLMLHFTLFGKSVEECGFHTLMDSIAQVKANPIMCSELCEILQYNFEKIDFIDEKVDLGFDSPLDLHCSYTRDQILVALGYLKPSTVREGVKYLPDKKIDVFFVTLNKSDKDYSPTTMYNDYSINEMLFHWQSQSTTSDHSSTGERYINHLANGSKLLLFVREFKKDRIHGNAPAYTFLGTANYLRHEGSRPMNVTLKLDKAIPAKYLKITNKLLSI